MEVLVWVMGDAGGTRVLIGSFETNGVIYRCAWADGEVDRGTYRTAKEEYSATELHDITQRAENGGYEMIFAPTVLRLPAPPSGSGYLNQWVEAAVWPVVEARMKVQAMAGKVQQGFVTGMSVS